VFERQLWFLVALAAGACAAGCGGTDSGQSAETAETATPKAATGKTAPSSPAHVSAADPADSLNALVADLAAGRGDTVFAKLPERYRKDLDRFLTERVRAVDADARRQTAEAVSRFAESLAEKEALVLASERFEIAGPAAEAARDHFGSLCRLVAATARWPGWGGQSVSDTKSLVSAIVSAVAKDESLGGDLRSLRFEVVSRNDDRAVLRVAGGDHGRELAVVRVDDAWIPATVAERWEALFGDESGTEEAFGASELTSFAGRLDEVSAALAKTSTQAEFDALAERAATLLLATAAQADQAPRAVRPDEFVTVEVLGEMTEEQKDRLVWQMTTLTDAPRSGLAEATDRADGAGIVVTVGPVADLEAFAKRLADLKVESVDPQKKTVTARFVGP